MEGKKVAEHQDRLDDELINSDDAGEMEESEVVAGSDARDSIVGRYRQFEKEELKRQGYTEDEIKLMVGTEDESEDEEKKPDDADAKEGDEDVSEDEEKEPEGEKKTEPDGGDAGKAEAEHEPEPDREPDRRELTVEEILPVKVKVKVNGQESEVTVAELQKNYQIAGHLTQQLQQVAAMRSQVEVAAAELERRKQEIEQEYTNLEERIFSEDACPAMDVLQRRAALAPRGRGHPRLRPGVQRVQAESRALYQRAVAQGTRPFSVFPHVGHGPPALQGLPFPVGGIAASQQRNHLVQEGARGGS